MPTRSKIVRRPRQDKANTDLMRVALFFFLILAFISGPVFFHQYFNSAEEHVSIFGAAYGMRLFYPGSNRILMVIPFITSWLETPLRILVAHFVVVVVSTSAALALLAHVLPRPLFFPFFVALLAAIALLFGGVMYQFNLSLVQPYLTSVAFSAISCVFFATSKQIGLRFFLCSFGAALLTLASAGINPSVTILFAFFFAFILCAECSAPVTRTSLRRPSVSRALGVVRENTGLTLGLVINVISTLVILKACTWYKATFPDYVKSNYSVDSYLSSQISLQELVDSFGFLIEFHQYGGPLGPQVSRWLVVLVLFSGLGSLAMWVRCRRSHSSTSRIFLSSFFLWLSAIVVIVILSQSAHIQGVANLIRGRYFTASYYVMIAAMCMSAAAASGALDQKKDRLSVSRVLCVGVLAVMASYFMLFIKWGVPSFERPGPEFDFHTVAEEVSAANAAAIIGSYWWVWNVQFELNKNAARAPNVTPVAIRTESFGLKAFQPIIKALSNGKGVKIACIEKQNPEAENDQSCESQLDFFREQGSFPLGEITKVGASEIGMFKLKYFELGLANPSDFADCTTSQILLRTKPIPPSVPGQESYVLKEDSFVYLQRPGSRTDWVLRFTQDDREEVVIVPNANQSYFHLLDHRISVLGSGCRLLVTVSRRDRLFPSTMKLDVR